MKTKHLFLMLGMFVLLFSCKDDCVKSREEISDLRNKYLANRSAENCYAYAAALQSYLANNCTDPDQISYDRIYQSFLIELPCYDPSTGGTVTPPTCDDGIQNGDEEGVDCGGSFCPPCPPPPPADVFINFSLRGNAYNFQSPTSTSNSGTSGIPFYVFSSGGLNSAQVEGKISIHFFQTNNVDITNFQSMIGFPYNFENPASQNPFGSLEITLPDGTTLSSVNAGNNENNSTIVVLNSSIQSASNVGGNQVERYRVRGIFNCLVTDGSTIDTLTNGNFELVFANY
jgi:hypothetical protein